MKFIINGNYNQGHTIQIIALIDVVTKPGLTILNRCGT